jgi:hypothetical protein
MDPIQKAKTIKFLLSGSYVFCLAVWLGVGLLCGIAVTISSFRIGLMKFASPVSFHPLVIGLLTLFYWPVLVPMYIDARRACLRGELGLKADQEKTTSYAWVRIICFLVMCTIPWFWYFSYYLCYPSMLAPFANDPTARLVSLAWLLLWQPIGLLPTLHNKSFSQWIQTCLLTVGPAVFYLTKTLPEFTLTSLTITTLNEKDQTTVVPYLIDLGSNLTFASPCILLIALAYSILMAVLTYPGIWVGLIEKLNKRSKRPEADVNSKSTEPST